MNTPTLLAVFEAASSGNYGYPVASGDHCPESGCCGSIFVFAAIRCGRIDPGLEITYSAPPEHQGERARLVRISLSSVGNTPGWSRLSAALRKIFWMFDVERCEELADGVIGHNDANRFGDAWLLLEQACREHDAEEACLTAASAATPEAELEAA